MKIETTHTFRLNGRIEKYELFGFYNNTVKG